MCNCLIQIQHAYAIERVKRASFEVTHEHSIEIVEDFGSKSTATTSMHFSCNAPQDL